MRRIRPHLTYANVMVTLLAIGALTGGVAYAADTIGSSDVIDNSLTSADLRNNQAVRGADVANGQLRGEDVGQTQFVNFTGTIGIINAHECVNKKVTGLPVDNKDHLVLTPQITHTKRDVIYAAKWDVSEPGDMWIQACNVSDDLLDEQTSEFNLLVIDAD